MTVVVFACEVEATPEQTWAVVRDPGNLPHWDRHIVAVEGIPPGGLRKGVRYTTVMRFVGVRAHISCEVLEWDAPLHSSIRLKGVLEATVSTTITPMPRGTCRLEHEVDYRFRGGPLGGFAARSLRIVGGPQFALRRGTLAQKRQIESGASE